MENIKKISCVKQLLILKMPLHFPGLINSHDHLDFNLFPQTGNRIYNNYTEWGRDIHEQNKEAISASFKNSAGPPGLLGDFIKICLTELLLL